MMPMDKNSPKRALFTLYRLHGCPFCERVVAQLNKHQLPFRSIYIPPTHSSRGLVSKVSGTRSVPVLVDEKTRAVVAESDTILRYLERVYGCDRVGEGGLPAFETTPQIGIGDYIGDELVTFVSKQKWRAQTIQSIGEGEPGLTIVLTPLLWGGKSEYWWRDICDRGWVDEPVTVCGLTAGQPFAIQRFIQDRNLPFGFIADPGSRISTGWGLTHDLDGMPNVVDARPSVVTTDSEGVITHLWIADVWPQSPPYSTLEAVFDSISRAGTEIN